MKFLLVLTIFIVLAIIYKYIRKTRCNKEMTIDEWRNKRLHRKCRFCVHGCHHSICLVNEPIENKKKGYIACNVREIYVNNNTPRIFCSMFKLNSRNNEEE